jgi:hypothetical protein
LARPVEIGSRKNAAAPSSSEFSELRTLNFGPLAGNQEKKFLTSCFPYQISATPMEFGIWNFARIAGL